MQGPGGLTLTNADNTIQGYGVIGNGGLTVINQAAGTINANSSGNTLTLNGNGGITNMGILEATSGGILNINNMTVSDVGDRILGNGGSVQIENATIIGGALTATNGGTFNQGVNGTSVTLDGLTAGPLTISSGTTWNTGNNSNTYVQGSIVNDGAIAVTAGGNSNSTLNLQANTTLSGGGTVTMGSSDGTGTAYIVQGPGGLTLTNADNTIQGYGVIGNGGLTVINQELHHQRQLFRQYADPEWQRRHHQHGNAGGHQRRHPEHQQYDRQRCGRPDPRRRRRRANRERHDHRWRSDRDQWRHL